MIVAKGSSDQSSYFIEIARGTIPGQTISNMFGHIPDVDQSDGLIAFWDEKQEVTFPTVAGPVYISSEDAGDASTFIGAALDADYLEHTVTATLDGQNAVQMVNLDPTKTDDFLWVNSALNVGTTASLGKIYISTTNTLTAGKPTDTTTIIGIVYFDAAASISHEVMSNGSYIVPGNKELLVTNIRRFIGRNRDADIVLRVHPYSELLSTHTAPLVIAEFEIYEVNIEDTFSVPSRIVSKTRVQFSARTENPNTKLSVDMSFIIADLEL